MSEKKTRVKECELSLGIFTFICCTFRPQWASQGDLLLLSKPKSKIEKAPSPY